MARQKNDGRGRLGGRRKGTPNKATPLKEWINAILEGGKDKFEGCLAELSPEEYIKVYTGLLNYVIPRQAPINAEDIVNRERDMLQQLMLTSPESFIDKITSKLKENFHENKNR